MRSIQKHTHIISSSHIHSFDTHFFPNAFFLLRYSSLSPYHLIYFIRDSIFLFVRLRVEVAVFANAYNAATINTGIINEHVLLLLVLRVCVSVCAQNTWLIVDILRIQMELNAKCIGRVYAYSSNGGRSGAVW